MYFGLSIPLGSFGVRSRTTHVISVYKTTERYLKDFCPRCLNTHAEPFESCPNPTYDLPQAYYVLEPEDFPPSPARLEIIELLKCPIDWEQIAPGHAIVFSLEHYWQEVASSCLKRGSEDLA